MGASFRRLRSSSLNIITLCLVTLSIAACGSNRDWFESAVAEQQRAGQKKVRLGDLTKFKWDRMCYFSPYAKSATLDIDNAEHEWVLIFYRGDKVAGRAEGRRRKLEIVLRGATAGNPPCFPADRIGALSTKRNIPHLTLTNAIK